MVRMRLMFWSSVVLVGVMAACAGASFWRPTVISLYGYVPGLSGVQISMYRGGAEVMLDSMGQGMASVFDVDFSFDSARTSGPLMRTTLLPHYDTIAIGPSGWIRAVWIPLWIPGAIVLLLTWRVWRSLVRMGKPGMCRACGYDQRGLVSGKCPECGAEVVK